MTKRFFPRAAFFASLVFCVGACKSKGDSGTPPKESAYGDIKKDFDKSEPPPEERKPVEGAEISKLEKGEQLRFEALADSLPSPCGAAHSLRTSRNNDKACARAPFAVEYVFELLSDGATDEEVKELYALRFREVEKKIFVHDAKMPHVGPTDAPVKIVEFYDYGCPACVQMKPILEEAVLGMETEVATFYKQFPLDSHPDSAGAARLAVVAFDNGKFKEMHDLLFGNPHAHKIPQLKEYAAKVGLNVGTLEKDIDAAGPRVEANKAEGQSSGVTGTPSIFINGRSYEGPPSPKYIRMWIQRGAGWRNLGPLGMNVLALRYV